MNDDNGGNPAFYDEAPLPEPPSEYLGDLDSYVAPRKNRRTAMVKSPHTLLEPQSPEGEIAIIGGMLQDPLAIALAVDKQLSATDFFDQRHRTLCEAIFNETEAGHPVDHIRIADYLRRHGTLQQVGGIEYIESTMGKGARLEYIEAYIRDVKDAALKRHSLGRLREAQQMSCNGVTPQEIADFLRNTSEELSRLSEAGESGATRLQLIPAPIFKKRPRPDFLVENLLVENTLSALVGPSGTYKSFIAISQAACIATGTPWHDRAVKKGPVIYISAEGSAGLGHRIAAWENYHGITIPSHFYVLPEAVQFLQGGDIEMLIREINRLSEPPVFIVVDTLARTMVGGDENSAQDMGIFISSCDRLRKVTGAHVEIIHHFGNNNKIRGSSALLGALDTSISIHRDEGRLTLHCEKQKDYAEFEDIGLVRRIIDITEDGSETSLIFEKTDETVQQSQVNQGQAQALAILQQFDKGLKCAEWEKNCEVNNIKRRSFYNYRDALVNSRRVRKVGNTYIATGH